MLLERGRVELMYDLYDALREDPLLYAQAVDTIRQIDPNLLEALSRCWHGDDVAFVLGLRPFECALCAIFAFVLAREDPASTPMLDLRFVGAREEEFFGKDGGDSIWDASRNDAKWQRCIERLTVCDRELIQALRGILRREKGLLASGRSVVRTILAFYFSLLLDSVAATSEVVGRYTFALKTPKTDQSSS